MKTLNTRLVSLVVGVLALATGECSAQYTLQFATNGSDISVTGYTGSPINVVLPDFVTTIAFGAFQGSGTLTNVEIPNSVTNIQDYVFNDCHSLLSITVDPGNAGYASSNGVVFNTNFTALVDYPEALPVTFYTIPDGVNNILSSAFSGCDLLQGVSFPGTLTNLGDEAFAFCYGLTNIILPDGVVNLGSSVFDSCGSLTNLSLSATVTNIGSDLLTDDSRLAGVTVDPLNPAFTAVDGVLFNKSVTVLYGYPSGRPGGEYAIPEGVTNILQDSFWVAPLTNIIIPASLTTIPRGAFYVATSLQMITIPATVTNIGSAAFSACYQLTTVFIQGNVATIADDAFGNCGNLTGVFFEGDAPSADCSVFASDTKLGAVYYLPGTMNWGPMFACLPTVNWGVPAPAITGTAAGFQSPAGGFGFALTGSSNALVSVQASTNLIDWTTIASVPLTNGSSFFLDPDANAYTNRFYRIHIP